MRADLLAPEVIAALQEAAQRKGMKDVAAEMDMAPSSLYAACNPYGDRSISKMGIELAIAIMRYTGDKKALAIMADALGCSILERGKPDKKTVAEESLQDFAAVNELAIAMQKGQRGGVIHQLAMKAHSEIDQSVTLYLDEGK